MFCYTTCHWKFLDKIMIQVVTRVLCFGVGLLLIDLLKDVQGFAPVKDNILDFAHVKDQ